jgi:hypothetical protein
MSERGKDCRVPLRRSFDSGACSGAVDSPPEWHRDGTWAARPALSVLNHLKGLFATTDPSLLWPFFSRLRRPAVLKASSQWRDTHPIPPGTPFNDLLRVTFELLCFTIEDDARRELALAQCDVLGLTDADLRRCDSFADALSRAEGALDALRRDVQPEELISGVRNRTQVKVIDAPRDRTVPETAQFDETLVLKLRDILRSIRLQNFSRRTTSAGADLACRGGLILSFECVEWYWEIVNAELAAAGFAQFDSADALYNFLRDACRCQQMHAHLREFVIALCKFGEDRGDQMLVHLRESLRAQLRESEVGFIELRADIFSYARKPELRLFKQLHAVKPAAVADLEICCGTVLWFAQDVVVRLTAKFAIEQVLEKEREATLAPGGHASFETALTTLFADALFSWLLQYFSDYGEGSWKNQFANKWGSDRAEFRATVWKAFFEEKSVALWHGLPLRVWVAGKDGAVVHEFFRRRQVNIEGLVVSMQHCKSVIDLVGY